MVIYSLEAVLTKAYQWKRDYGLTCIPQLFRVEAASEAKVAKGKLFSKSPISMPKNPDKAAIIADFNNVVFPELEKSGELHPSQWKGVLAKMSPITMNILQRLVDNQSSSVAFGFVVVLLPSESIGADMLGNMKLLDFDIYPCAHPQDSPGYFYYEFAAGVPGGSVPMSYEEAFAALLQMNPQGINVKTINAGLHSYIYDGTLMPAKQGVEECLYRVYPATGKRESVVDFPVLGFFIYNHYQQCSGDYAKGTYASMPPHPLLQCVKNAQKRRILPAILPVSAAVPAVPVVPASDCPVVQLLDNSNLKIKNKAKLRRQLTEIANTIEAIRSKDIIDHCLARIKAAFIGEALTYQAWSSIMFACKNHDYPYEDFDNWSKDLDGYNEEGNRSLWIGYPQYSTNCHIGSAIMPTYDSIVEIQEDMDKVIQAVLNFTSTNMEPLGKEILRAFLPILEREVIDAHTIVQQMLDVYIAQELLYVRDENRAEYFYKRMPSLPYWEQIGLDRANIALCAYFKKMRKHFELLVAQCKMHTEDPFYAKKLLLNYQNFSRFMYQTGYPRTVLCQVEKSTALHTFAELFASNNRRVAFRNKILQLDEKECVECIDPSYDHKIINFLDYNLLPAEECEAEISLLDDFFKKILFDRQRDPETGEMVVNEEKHKFIMTWMAHRFFGKELPHSEVLCLVGSGKNGKGVLNSVMRQVFGRNAQCINKSHIFSKEASTAIAEVLEREPRVLFASELDYKSLTNDHYIQIKKFTTDTVICRKLYATSMIHKKIQATFVFESNRPLFDNIADDPGMNRRFACIKFRNKVFGNVEEGSGYQANCDHHIDISNFPRISNFTDRHRSAVVHILCRYINENLQLYSSDQELVSINQCPISKVLSNFISWAEYQPDPNDPSSKSWDIPKKFKNINSKALIPSQAYLKQYVAGILQYEMANYEIKPAEIAIKISIDDNMARLLPIQSEKATGGGRKSYKNKKYLNCLYLPHLPTGPTFPMQ